MKLQFSLCLSHSHSFSLSVPPSIYLYVSQMENQIILRFITNLQIKKHTGNWIFHDRWVWADNSGIHRMREGKFLLPQGTVDRSHTRNPGIETTEHHHRILLHFQTLLNFHDNNFFQIYLFCLAMYAQYLRIS